jgi:zinc transporter, ZIP family
LSTVTPLLGALLVAAAAAGASALAALPFLRPGRVTDHWLGLASGLAGGLMLGLAYVLLITGMRGPTTILAASAVLGILFVVATDRVSGQPAAGDARTGYRQLLGSALHAAHEGVAIGAALAADFRFGMFTAAAIAVHNVPESASLVAGLRARGARLGEAAGLAVAADANQVLFAVAALALASAWPALRPWITGFAVGALVQLVLVELLPGSYRSSGRASIALVTIAAMGAVTILRTLVP